MAHATANVPYLEPREVKIDSDCTVVSFDIGTLLIRKIQNDASFRKKCYAKSEKWKKGDAWKVEPKQLTNVDSGVGARWHPHLMRPATEEEADDFRIGLIAEADDIEVLNTTQTPHMLH